MGNREKLPKWAQQELDVLERNVEHWKKKALSVGEGKSGPVRLWEPNAGDVTLSGLTIAMDFHGDEIRFSWTPEGIDVNANERVAILPRAANGFIIQGID